MAAISGFGGSLRVNTSPGSTGVVALPVGDWTVTVRGETVDVSTLEHGMMHDYKLVGREYEVTFNAFWVNEQDPLTTAVGGQNLTPGGFNATQLETKKVGLDLYFCKGNNRGFTFAYFLVENVTVSAAVRDVIKYSITGRATGEVVFTTSSASPTGTPVLLPGASGAFGAPSQLGQ